MYTQHSSVTQRVRYLGPLPHNGFHTYTSPIFQRRMEELMIAAKSQEDFRFQIPPAPLAKNPVSTETSIAFTVAEEMKAAKRPAATFFSHKHAPSAAVIIPTIAYQLASAFPRIWDSNRE
ncbi:hypothetical protein DFH29DRAFT_1000038 [Suillus ampliporus]|nr:hypothetical protein DFH29DRAFT_1000038 [Suillus ampliporus]